MPGADDAVGLSDKGHTVRKLSAMIVQCVGHNGNAEMEVTSEPGSCVAVTITFKQNDAGVV